MQEIKIPKGTIKLIFENNHGFILTAKQIWDALTDYIFNELETTTQPVKETTNEQIYDDTNPNYITQSHEE